MNKEQRIGKIEKEGGKTKFSLQKGEDKFFIFFRERISTIEGDFDCGKSIFSNGSRLPIVACLFVRLIIVCSKKITLYKKTERNERDVFITGMA